MCLIWSIDTGREVAGCRASQIGSPEATRLELPMAARMERRCRRLDNREDGKQIGKVRWSRAAWLSELGCGYGNFFERGWSNGGLVVVLFGAGEK